MRELGVLVCDEQEADIATLQENLYEYISQTYTGDIRLRFHQANSLAIAQQKVREYRDSLAVIVVDLRLTDNAAMVNVDKTLSELKDPNTRICYIGSPKEVAETALFLKRAYNLSKHDYGQPAELIHRSDPRRFEMMAQQAMQYALVGPSEDPRYIELRRQVDQMNQKLFYVGEDTASPPLAQMVRDQQRIGAVNAKDIKRLYDETEALAATIEECDRRLTALENWRDYWASVRRTFFSFQGGWGNELLRNGFMVGVGLLVARLIEFLFG